MPQGFSLPCQWLSAVIVSKGYFVATRGVRLFLALSEQSVSIHPASGVYQDLGSHETCQLDAIVIYCKSLRHHCPRSHLVKLADAVSEHQLQIRKRYLKCHVTCHMSHVTPNMVNFYF